MGFSLKKLIKKSVGLDPVSTRPAQSAAAPRARATGELGNRKALDY